LDASVEERVAFFEVTGGRIAVQVTGMGTSAEVTEKEFQTSELGTVREV